MVNLIGSNLGERHRDLNAKVSEAADKKIDLEILKSQEEECDIDKLYKIDLASRYKNIQYILDVLKCGDVFYITRALKCLWLYNDEYSDYINSNYCTNHIFPYMSMKMQRKILTAVSTHLKNSERAIGFYTYCREAKLEEYAYKFLVLTPDNFKLNIMKDEDYFVSRIGQKFLEKFIGSSFEVAQTYMKLHDHSSHVIYLLRFLYHTSDEWYLDVLEKYELNFVNNPNCLSRLGLRLSKDILKNHKSRVIKYPTLYINKLSKNMLVKYLTMEDVKSLATALLPKSAYCFWSIDFYHSYKFILDKIPTNEHFGFIKELFNSKYNDKKIITFELAIEFYNLKYYEMLSIEEREKWALVHIERDEELPGIENYIWYKFVSFKRGFQGIKRYIFLSADESKRSQIVNVLPETARCTDDLTKILEYYYQRHVNESEVYKESFINKVIECHDMYSFDIESWTALDSLFCSLDVYTSFERESYKARSLFYHILHNIVIPESHEEYIKYCFIYNITSLIKELSVERNNVISKFLLTYYAEIIKSLMEKPCDVNVKDDNDFVAYSTSDEIHNYVNKVWNVIHCFKRNHDECPDIVLQYMKSNEDFYQYHEYFKPKFIPNTEEDFVRWLKQDEQMAIDGIDKIRCNTYRWKFRLCRLFRKLKVYFPSDVGKEYLDYFMEYLSDVPKGRREYRNIKMAVVGVFYLAGEDLKVTFMDKNVPETPKIDHRNINNGLFQVQKAICRLAYHSRPPLPLASVQKYITGDYIHYFLPVLYHYQANLPSISKFIEIILDAPVSIQKHGLRLAFRSYKRETLKPIIINAWQKTKNVSLRKLLYETLFYRMLNESIDGQKELYEILKLYTSELNHNDDDNIYLLLLSDNLPDYFKGDFIETSWHTVSKLSDKTVDMRRKISIIRHMEENIHFVNREFPRIHIIDDHVSEMFHTKKIKTRYNPSIVGDIIEAKWNLTVKYIVSFNNNEEQPRSLQVMSYIINKTIEQWNYVHKNTYVLRKFYHRFISKIMSKEPKIRTRCTFMMPAYSYVLETFTNTLKEEEIYLITWELKLAILCRKIIEEELMTDAGKNDNMLFKKIFNVFGKQFGAIINSLVEKNEFQYCFYNSVTEIVINIGRTICEFLSVCYSYFEYYMTDSLIDIKITETHVLALMILPTDPRYNWHAEHNSIIKKIKQFDSKEIHNFLYKKYVQSDYSVRNVYREAGTTEPEILTYLTDSD